MTERRYFRLVHTQARQRAAEAIAAAPDGYIVELREPTRSLAQNARVHAMFDEIAKQKEWYGQYLTGTDWKRMFLALREGIKVVPGIVPGTFVPIGMRSRDLTISECSDLMIMIEMFAAEHGLTLGDEVDA